MSDTPEPPEFSAASHAYEHAEHAGDHPAHRLDVTDAPRWPKPPPTPAALSARPEERVLTHRIESPGRTAFRFGFGFAAGVWTFRALVLLAIWTVLAVAISALLMRAFHS